MGRVMHALCGAAVAFGLFGAGASAQPVSHDDATAQQALFARIAKPYGAALHSSPATNAEIAGSRPCGDVLPVLGESGGWVKVWTGATEAWVGGSRVTVGAPPPPADCDGGRFMEVGESVTTYVPTGCLSLREEPSRNAAIDACVQNGYQYQIINGPVDPGTGEDWFGVYSQVTGSGWTLAEYLFP